MDVFTASIQGNKVLVNDGVQFHVTDPGVFGLPDASLSAQFVDFNNDSRVDLHTFPGGLYNHCLLYTSPSPRDATLSRMPSSA